ncbi:MAG: hypothetical protein WC436_05810 [Candidatus Babeliales bacterium]
MNTLDLKKVVSISCAGHVAMFALLAFFGFSFGSVSGRAAFTPVIFCGSMLPQTLSVASAIRPSFVKAGVEPAFVPRSSPAVPVPSDYYVKPAIAVPYISSREAVINRPVFTEAPKRRDPVLLMHPLLPYQFGLYFKDRQSVHIELEFKITRADGRNFVSLRRKISSGNLEADLLSMRYIGHYLFIQQARFVPSVWQTVKIEFSPHTR